MRIYFIGKDKKMRSGVVLLKSSQTTAAKKCCISRKFGIVWFFDSIDYCLDKTNKLKATQQEKQNKRYNKGKGSRKSALDVIYSTCCRV